MEKVVLEGGVEGSPTILTIYKERIKVYKETPLSFPKTQNTDPLAS